MTTYSNQLTCNVWSDKNLSWKKHATTHMVKKVVATWWLSSTTLSLYWSAIGSFATTRNALVRLRQSKSWNDATRARVDISSSFNPYAPLVRMSNKYLQPMFHQWFQNPSCDYTIIKHNQHDLSLLTSCGFRFAIQGSQCESSLFQVFCNNNVQCHNPKEILMQSRSPWTK
jgi:hypothetical protein